jgi:hypothetical protein
MARFPLQELQFQSAGHLGWLIPKLFVDIRESILPTAPYTRLRVIGQAFKHIFTSPSSVDREPRATRSGNARIHGMKKVTIPSLAYVATQV